MGHETERSLEHPPPVTRSVTPTQLSLITLRQLAGKDMPSPVVAIFQISDPQSELNFPSGLSFFDPHLKHYVKETLEIGGEAYVSKDPDGKISGLFIYDGDEKSGTIFTRSQQVFECFHDLKPFESLFAEIRVGHSCEDFDIFTINLEGQAVDHRFSYPISIEEGDQRDEIRQFMAFTHPGTNKNWVDVALNNGDKCFTVRLEEGIAGVGWASNVNATGRLYTLFVKPQFRRVGIGGDLVFARLLWLKSKGAHSAFSEISSANSESSRLAIKAGMKSSGELFQYFRKDPMNRAEGQPLLPA